MKPFENKNEIQPKRKASLQLNTNENELEKAEKPKESLLINVPITENNKELE